MLSLSESYDSSRLTWSNSMPNSFGMTSDQYSLTSAMVAMAILSAWSSVAFSTAMSGWGASGLSPLSKCVTGIPPTLLTSGPTGVPAVVDPHAAAPSAPISRHAASALPRYVISSRFAVQTTTERRSAPYRARSPWVGGLGDLTRMRDRRSPSTGGGARYVRYA